MRDDPFHGPQSDGATSLAQIDTPGEAPERRVLARLSEAGALARLERGAALCHERQSNDHVGILETGLCVAIKRTRDGQQQNVAIYVPGDILDHETFTLGAATSTIIAMTPVTYHRLSLPRLREAMDRDGDVARAFSYYVAFQGALAQEWMLGLGRRPALERTAHLLCELVCRMRAAGQGSEIACPFPLTQTDLSDILGLSVVHVNRTLQRLRQTRYVTIQRGRLEILDWTRLAALAGFETAYLKLVSGA